MSSATSRSLVDEPALREWADGILPGDGPFTVERITTGHSNELFRISRSGQDWVLRRPPLVPNSPTAHDMEREYRVLQALATTDVPHGRPWGLCADPEVIGAPFYIVDLIDGVTLYEKGLTPELQPHAVAVADALIDALAAIHQVPWQEVGLTDFGRPEGYTERQAVRWKRQLDSYSFRDIPELDEVAEWLADTCPGTRATTLIHGDYGLHNVMFAPTPPARIRAVVDWETSTIGDPLADLGYLLADWLEPGEQDPWGPLGFPFDTSVLPDRAHMVQRYVAATGLEVSDADLAWYRALGQFKIAVILEGSYGRFRAGDSDDPFFATLEERVPLLARHALAIAQHDA